MTPLLESRVLAGFHLLNVGIVHPCSSSVVCLAHFWCSLHGYRGGEEKGGSELVCEGAGQSRWGDGCSGHGTYKLHCCLIAVVALRIHLGCLNRCHSHTRSIITVLPSPRLSFQLCWDRGQVTQRW